MALPFNEDLLDHIRYGRNDVARAMINRELALMVDDTSEQSTLLHHAAQSNNATIAHVLIDLGAKVNHYGGASTTPLIEAINNQSVDVAKILLNAGARLDLVDHRGTSALLVGLNWAVASERSGLAFELFQLIANKVRGETNKQRLADTLFSARCDVCQATTLGDIEVMQCMLNLGADVNSKEVFGITSLHVAVEFNDRDMAEWLVNCGVELDALDDDGSSALTSAVNKRNKDIVRLLLENGARPDVEDVDSEHTPLYVTYMKLDNSADAIFDCAVLLLQYGAKLPNSEKLREMFQAALEYCSDDKPVNMLIAHLAMLVLLGEAVNPTSTIESLGDEYRIKPVALKKYYKECKEVLGMQFDGSATLLCLLDFKNGKLQQLARREAFDYRTEWFTSQHKLKELYPYYYDSLMAGIAKADRAVQ